MNGAYFHMIECRKLRLSGCRIIKFEGRKLSDVRFKELTGDHNVYNLIVWTEAKKEVFHRLA